MAKTAISIVIPVLDELPNIPDQSKEILGAMDGYPGGFELIYVDDGSTDGTPEAVEAQSRTDPRIRLVRLDQNHGQVPAMVQGVGQAKGEIIVTLDGDRQHDPADIPALVAKVRSGFDMVCGYRKGRQDPYFGKILPSRIFNFVLRILFRVPIHDSSCTLRAFLPEVFLRLNLYREAISFIPIYAALAGYRITEMVVSHRPRIVGQAKYDSPARFGYTLREMFAIFFGKRKHVLPDGK